VQELPAGTTARVGVKATNDFAGDFLATDTLEKSGTGSETIYSGDFNLNTVALEELFDDEPASLTAMLEVQWTTAPQVGSSLTLPVTIYNDVIRGDEGAPAELPIFYTSETSDFLATQAQAEAGQDNTKWMSPLRVAQAIEELGGGGGVSSWNDLTDKPSTFPPSTHTHPLSALTQSSATSGQVPTWDGTSWTPQTPSGGGSGGAPAAHASSHATGGSDAITPASIGAAAATHTHVLADVTGLQSALDGKQTAGSYAAATHTHAATDITSGTLAIARIPTGTTSSTVCIGNDSRLSDARTPASHTHGNITNAGAIGTSSGAPIITGASGVLQAGAFGTTAGTFCAGNDARLLNITGITAIAVVATMPASPVATTLYIVTG
jgi:hypothetical protein